jgi:hypothetical protein
MPAIAFFIAGCLCFGVSAHFAIKDGHAQIAAPSKPEDRPMNGKNTVNINGSNNTVSIGHIGDVNVPGPKLEISAAQGKQNPDGTFVAAFDALVVAPYTPGSLRVEAWAEGVTALNVAPQRTGGSISGHSGVRSDHAFATVMSPFGHYKIFVTMKKPTNVDIKYGFDQ